MGKDQRNKHHGLDTRRNARAKAKLRKMLDETLGQTGHTGAPSPIEQLDQIIERKKQ